MKTSFWRRWWQAARGGKRSGPVARRLRRPPWLEALEDRTLLSGTPHMLLDTNPATFSSWPSGFVTIGSTTYFTADDGIHGRELWKNDGTAAGTRMVADINPGSANSTGGELTNVNGTLFFPAEDDTHHNGLWKSDGTAAGTVLVKDLGPSGGRFPQARMVAFALKTSSVPSRRSRQMAPAQLPSSSCSSSVVNHSS